MNAERDRPIDEVQQGPVGDAPKMIDDDYLGDGVYASFDGYYIVLDLRAQDSTTRIALEPQVLEALDRYRARVRRRAGADERTPTIAECILDANPPMGHVELARLKQQVRDEQQNGEHR